MEQYHTLLKEVLKRGDVQYEPRTQEHIMGLSAWQSTYDLREGFPLMTTKKVPPRLPFEELFWKLRGERNVKGLVDRDVNIWTANAFDNYLKRHGLREQFPKHSKEWNEEFEKYSERLKEDPDFAQEGDLGPVYGYQWRHWRDRNGEETDQLANLLKNIPEKPGSRYHILNAWNPGELSEMALGPCPFWHQFNVFGDNMDLTMVQRSADVFLGVPFNIAQDSLLAHLVANETGFNPRFFNHSYINVHVYLGVPPRAEFWTNQDNVDEFREKLGNIKEREEYKDLKEWYLKTAPEEAEGNEKKDHMPFILEQLSKSPIEPPLLRIEQDIPPLLEAIEMDPMNIVDVEGYKWHKWNAKATMAS